MGQYLFITSSSYSYHARFVHLIGLMSSFNSQSRVRNLKKELENIRLPKTCFLNEKKENWLHWNPPFQPKKKPTPFTHGGVINPFHSTYSIEKKKEQVFHNSFLESPPPFFFSFAVTTLKKKKKFKKPRSALQNTFMSPTTERGEKTSNSSLYTWKTTQTQCQQVFPSLP